MIKDYLIYLYPLLSNLIGHDPCSGLRDLIYDKDINWNDQQFIYSIESKLNDLASFYSQSDPNILTYKQWIRDYKISLII